MRSERNWRETMAVSGNVQRAMYSKSADHSAYPATFDDAERLAAEWRASGKYRRVQVTTYNDGNRERPRRAPKVLGWLK
jgi:hypothetical protein